MLIYNFGDWTEWLVPQKVTFLPDLKLISIHPGTTQIDVQVDLYSAWKEWIRYYDNSKWAAAFTTFGGDPTGVNQFAPRYFFLTNGWKVHVSNMSVVVQTNLYSDDGLSPFVIENAAVTNRASDVPIIKSEIEQRLEYGDRVYYDENSIYSGTAYPNGTIVQPVNNTADAISIANLYNIKNFYCLSDVNINDSGNIFENYTIIADRENLTVSISDGNYLNNMEWNGFIINSYFGGGENKFVDCIIINALDVSGQMKSCQMNGTTRVWDNLVTSLCYSGVAGSSTPVFDMNEFRNTRLSIRSYSGGVQLLWSNFTGDTATIELIAGQIKIEPSCTAGYIDLRGVGYITDNSSGATVKTTGFIDSFENYIEASREVDEQLSYNNRLYIDQLSGFTGSTYPVGTQYRPCNNAIDLFTLSKNLNIQNIYVKYELNLENLPIEGNDFNAYSDTPHSKLTVDNISGSRLKNVNLNGFDIIDSDFAGNPHYFERCLLENVKGLAGHLIECDLEGLNSVIEIYENTTLAFCHPKSAGEPPKIKMSNPSGTTCAFAGWNGDLIIDTMSHVNDWMIIDVNSGSIVITSACTNGRIDIRGVANIIDNSIGDCLVVRDGQIQGSPVEYNGEIVIDVVNGSTGSVYPHGSDQEPVNNLSDAISLLGRYKMNKIRVVGALTIDNGEDISGIAFSAERSTNNYLFITSAITSSTYIQNLTINVTQSGSTRYTNCVILGIDNFDGGLKDCLIVGNINLSGVGSNYMTDCGTYTTNTNNKVKIFINDKKLNMIRSTGFYELSTKTGSDTTTIDMMGGIIEIGSGCTNGIIYIGGICEVIDNSAPGCTVINQSISRKTIEDSTWDATITDHQMVDTTGYALYNVSAGATPEVIAEAVWSMNITGVTSDGTAAQTLTRILELNTGTTIKLDTVYEDIKRVLGLTQENFLIKDHVYSTDDLLQSATIRLFENSTDCDSEINPMAEYEMTALYDSKGRLTNYKVTKT